MKAGGENYCPECSGKRRTKTDEEKAESLRKCRERDAIRDAEIVEVECGRCHKMFTLTRGRIRRRPKDKPNICPECWNNHRKEFLSEEVLESKKLKTQTAWKNKSDEEVKAIMDGRRETYAKMSPERLAEISNNRSIAMKKVAAARPAEEIIRLSKISSENMTRYWKNLSPEKREERRLKSLATREEASKRLKKVWEDISLEEYEDFSLKRSLGHEKKARFRSKSEVIFSDLLSLNEIPHQIGYSSRFKDERFNELFPENPVTGAKRISPYHLWDFRIMTIPDILVDIDGSIHTAKSYKGTGVDGRTYEAVDDHIFRDSMRPYQTDGKMAFSVYMPRNKIDKDTVVTNIVTGDTMSIDEFIAFLNILQENEIHP